jgi:hypothetical protein
MHFLLLCGPFLSKDHFLWNRNHSVASQKEFMSRNWHDWLNPVLIQTFNIITTTTKDSTSLHKNHNMLWGSMFSQWYRWRFWSSVMWFPKHYNPSKCQEILTQQHIVIFSYHKRTCDTIWQSHQFVSLISNQIIYLICSLSGSSTRRLFPPCMLM